VLTVSGIVLLTITVLSTVSPTNFEIKFAETRLAVGGIVKEAGSNEVIEQSQSDRTATPQNLKSLPVVSCSNII
jgi:hypothetical protein